MLWAWEVRLEPAWLITTENAAASIWRWRRDLTDTEANLLTRPLHDALVALDYIDGTSDCG